MEQALVVEQETLGVRRGEWKGLGKEGRKARIHCELWGGASSWTNSATFTIKQILLHSLEDNVKCQSGEKFHHFFARSWSSASNVCLHSPFEERPCFFFWHSADFVHACYSHADAIWRELNPLWFVWDLSDSLLTSTRNLRIPLCWAWVAIFRSLMVSFKNEIWPDHWEHNFCNISFPLLVKHVQCLSLDTLWSTRTRTHMTCAWAPRVVLLAL